MSATGASGARPAGSPVAGAGSVVSGTVEVNQDSLLYIEVGGPGTLGGGGFNGGGATAGGGGGGGGASDVRTASGLPATRLIVAGGGGGAGTTGTCAALEGTPLGGGGGNAGTTASAADGQDAALCTDATGTPTIATLGGDGATITAGVGAGGDAGTTTVTGASNGAAGTLGVGGAASAGGGGGGGGWYGGGGGGSGSTTGPATDTESAAGGGGGISLVPFGGSAGLATVGTPGSVTIVYTALPPLADLAVTMSGTHSGIGGARFTETITVTNNGPGPSFIETTSVNMPGHLTLFAAPHSTVSHGRLHWSESLIASGASVTYKITFRAWPRFAGNVTFTATATEDGSVDPNTADNSYSLTVHVKHPAHWHGRPLA